MGTNQLLGYSNKVFLYQFQGVNTFSIRFRYEFVEDIKIEELKESIEEALKLYPEFRIKIVHKGNRFYSEENDKPVAFFEGLNHEHVLGSEETNRYLFYFMYEKKTLIVTHYHGMTDTKGILTMMGTALYFYAKKTDVTLSNEEIDEIKGLVRTTKEDIPIKEQETFDPYGMLSDDNIAPKGIYSNLQCLFYPGKQYPDESREVYRCEIEFSLATLLKKTKEDNVSVTPLLISVLSKALYQMDGADKDRDVVAMMPVDLRKRLNINTLVNFSDGINVYMKKDDFNLSHKETAKLLKSRIIDQMQRENFIKIITDKVHMVQAFEESNEELKELLKKNLIIPTPEFNPLSYAFTYPGNLNMAKGIDKLLNDMHYSICTRATFATGSSFNDNFRLVTNCRCDDDSWAKNVIKDLKEIGIDAKLNVLGRVKGDVCNSIDM
ncbi:MAG: hypothetical protein K5644_03530 [Lachnospiraceae bacterium]|nr:hypothetical protein [Lachnospiraceae bacterium]